MAKRKQGKQRPFRPEALEAYAVPALRPRLGPGGMQWRYTITIPLEEIEPRKRQKATAEDLQKMQWLFLRHFGGLTRPPSAFGYGLRDPDEPDQAPEMNYNTYFAILTSPVPEAEAYFRVLRAELEAALDEGVILVERQEVWIP
jgi:hypothetical protein